MDKREIDLGLTLTVKVPEGMEVDYSLQIEQLEQMV